MRGLVRNRAQAEEEESVFVTMTDLTISFLLIVMILLAFFATQLSSQDTVPREQYEVIRYELREARVDIRRLETELEVALEERDAARDERDAAIVERDVVIVERDQLRAENTDLSSRISELEAQIARLEQELADVKAERDDLLDRMPRLQDINPLEAYLSQAIEQRREILIELRERLMVEFPDLQVVISPEQDALRFQGEGLFRSGSSQLQSRQRQIVETMGRLLDEILVCFTLGERANRGPGCDSGNALIEAVQIEGHTDSDGSDLNNLRLSTDRANATLLVMLDDGRTILAHENIRGQPVMSVSGYGEMRPIAPNDTVVEKAANRRIDLRIIMYAPSTVEEVEQIGRRLDALRAAGGSE